MYRKSVLHPLKYRFAVNFLTLSRSKAVESLVFVPDGVQVLLRPGATLRASLPAQGAGQVNCHQENRPNLFAKNPRRKTYLQQPGQENSI